MRLLEPFLLDSGLLNPRHSYSQDEEEEPISLENLGNNIYEAPKRDFIKKSMRGIHHCTKLVYSCYYGI